MEPERPIEKILRAAAAKRRAEPGKALSLHPVDRKALQAEVAKVHGAKAEPAKSTGRGWAGLWPRIGWSFALVVGLAVAVTMMLPRSGPGPRSFTLAQNELSRTAITPGQSSASATRSVRDDREADRFQTTTTAGQRKEAQSPAAAPSRPEATAAAPALAERRRYGVAQTATPAAPPPPGASTTPANEPMSERLLKAKDANVTDLAAARLSDSKVQTTNMVHSTLSSAAASNQEGQLADRSKQEVAANGASPRAPAASALSVQPGPQIEKPAPLTLRHKFVQALPSAGIAGVLAQSTPPILSSFDFEQTGSAIRIIDQDGSIYQGTTQSPPAVNRRFRGRGIGDSLASTSTYYFDRNSPSTLFTVAGTNVTSGQFITFQGQLLGSATKTSTQDLEMKRSTSPSSSSASGTAGTSGLLSTDVQLSGTLKIGTNVPVGIRALPQSRK
jgi:hypothetical protein